MRDAERSVRRGAGQRPAGDPQRRSRDGLPALPVDDPSFDHDSRVELELEEVLPRGLMRLEGRELGVETLDPCRPLARIGNLVGTVLAAGDGERARFAR